MLYPISLTRIYKFALRKINNNLATMPFASGCMDNVTVKYIRQ